MYDPLGIQYDPLGLNKETSWGVEDTARAAAAVIGGFAAMPVAGVIGYDELISSGPEAATKKIEEISAFPSKLLKTRRQKQAAEKVGEIISWPFVKAGKGWAGIAELASTGDLQKATDVIEGRSVGSNISVPIADIAGQVVGMGAVGVAGKAVKARLKPVAERPFRPIEEKPISIKTETEPVYDPLNIKPEPVTVEPIVETLPEAKVEPPPAEIVQPGAKVGINRWANDLAALDREVIEQKDQIIRWSRNQAEADGWLDKWTPEKAIDEHYGKYVRGLGSASGKPLKKGETWRGRLTAMVERTPGATAGGKQTWLEGTPEKSSLIPETLYHETSLENFKDFDLDHVYGMYVSNDPILAIGQQGRGILIKYKPDLVRGYADYSKPSSKFLAGQGKYEIVLQSPKYDTGGKIIDSITLKKDFLDTVKTDEAFSDLYAEIYKRKHLDIDNAIRHTDGSIEIPWDANKTHLKDLRDKLHFVLKAPEPGATSGGKQPLPIGPKKLTQEIQSEPGYVYHATNSERLSEIADTGILRTHKPGEFTDQGSWPDGSTQKRAYFSNKANVVWQFAPEEGNPVVIRTKGAGLKEEIAGDVYSNKPISIDNLEYLGKDDIWHPVSELKSPEVLLPKDKGPGTETLFSGVDPTRIKEVATSLYNAVKSPPKWTTFTEALGKFGGRIQMGNLEMHRYAQGLKKRVPDKAGREAIVNYLQADGDIPTLVDRYNKTKANPKTANLAEGYARAGKLNPEELKVAAEVKEHYEERLREAIDVDMLDAGVENYVNQVWEKENPITAKLRGEILTGKLAPNPSLIRKRIFDSYFEGEQAEYKPKNKDIGFLLTSYDQAFNKAIASRAFIKSLNEKLATDGRPLTHPSGMGTLIPKEGVTETVLIKPRLKPEEFGDYQPINHPALRKWKWAAKAEGEGINPVTGEPMPTGTPIFLQGDLLVHPEIYKHLKNVLGTSALRQHPVGKAALTTVQSLKGTLLSLSGFHQTHVAQHAATHKVNPFTVPAIDLTNPTTRSLIEHGVSVADHASMDLFSEGMASSGLINKIPGIGPMMQKYTEYLFKDYIPRLKMDMASKAYERNKKRYGKDLSDDQIQFLTGQQANAAFGELNYDMMGRNKTFQDVARLVLLAPDFLEARARFASQAVMPYGKEQFMAAAVRGALGMYVGARVVNGIFNNGDMKWDKYFNVVIGGREYSIRSIQGDVQHLFADPRSFVYHRLNPTIVRTAIEYLTSRDEMGRYRDISDQTGDFIRAHIPIPIQGALKSSDRKIWQSMLASVGVTSYETRTAFDRAVQEEKGKKYVSTPLKSERDRMKLVSEYGREYKEAIKSKEPLGKIADKLRQDLKDGKLYEEDLETIHSMATVSRTLHNLKQLSVEDVMPIWDKALPEEKQQYLESFVQKIENLSENHPERYKKLLPELRKLFKKETPAVSANMS